jgi:single-strand DNA-binding protein
MNGLNKVMLIGTVGKDPVTVTFESGAKKSDFSIATNESFKNKDGEKTQRTEWHNIVAWGNLAEIVEKYIKKGNAVYVEGSIRRREWTDKSGSKRYSFDINAENIQMLGGKPAEQKQENQKAPEPQQEIFDLPDDDLPF